MRRAIDAVQRADPSHNVSSSNVYWAIRCFATSTASAVAELVHWYGLRTNPRFPEYWSSVQYWIITIAMILVAGIFHLAEFREPSAGPHGISDWIAYTVDSSKSNRERRRRRDRAVIARESHRLPARMSFAERFPGCRDGGRSDLRSKSVYTTIAC